MSALGLEPGDFEGEVFEVFPENWPSFLTFEAMSTQWRANMGGATGLDYGPLPAVMDLLAVPAPDRPAIFGALRAMEHAALDEMRKDG